MLLAGWAADTGAASVRISRLRHRDNESFDVKIKVEDLPAASFSSAAGLVKALQQPCWRLGLVCVEEKEATDWHSEGPIVVMRRMPSC